MQKNVQSFHIAELITTVACGMLCRKMYTAFKLQNYNPRTKVVYAMLCEKMYKGTWKHIGNPYSFIMY